MNGMGHDMDESEDLPECGSWPLPYVAAPMNTPTGIQRCDCCAPDWFGDLDAAWALAMMVGGEVRFWQHEADRDPAETFPFGYENDDDLAEAGYKIRTYGGWPERADDCILSGTDPWVEVDGRAVDWVHWLRFEEIIKSRLAA